MKEITRSSTSWYFHIQLNCIDSKDIMANVVQYIALGTSHLKTTICDIYSWLSVNITACYC